MDISDFKSNEEIAWCPGCGNFGILTAVNKSLSQLARHPKDILFVSGIGQASKLPHYVNCNCFNGLHGRTLPVAAAAKIANRNLTVLVTTGDGDCYGEGGNHLIHNIRRNTDITVIVHDNQVYGLTKGQSSPTSDPGYVTKIQEEGVILEPLHPLEMAIALGAGFVARGYSLETEHLSWLIGEGIRHKGFSLIDVLQPCVSFNKKNTYEWYSKRVYKVNDTGSYDPENKMAAYEKSHEWGDRIPIGIIYRAEKETYEEKRGLSQRIPLVDEQIEDVDIKGILSEFV